VVHSVG